VQPQAWEIHVPRFSCGIEAGQDQPQTPGLLSLNTCLAAGFIKLSKALCGENWLSRL
jgi:hypothetical protein